MQINPAESLLLDPIKDRQHDLSSNSASAEFRLDVDIQDNRPLRARILRVRGPRTKQNASSASDLARRSFLRQPMMVSMIRHRMFKPRSRDSYHPIEFFDSPFAHVAKHRTPMMKDHLQIRHLSFTNNKFGLHLIHQTNVMPWVAGWQV